MKIERDIAVPTRRGSHVSVDVFLPDGTGPWPVIATMSPYGKDVHWAERYPLYDEADQGPNAVWETPDPDWWTARGYVVLRADSPGTGASPGPLDLLGPREVEGFADVIEWAGTRPWSNGKVGSLGISWLAMLQWLVAARRPRHLAAIIPWEGSSDPYREFGRQGGIFSNAFLAFWWRLQIDPQRFRVDGEVDERDILLFDEMKAREFVDDWYLERTPDLERIQVPVLAVGNWGSLHLHQRGIVEGFLRAGSPHRRLIITSGTHIGPFYEPWAKAEQLRFLDRWLKDEPNGAELDPPVRLAIRVGDDIVWRDEREWPLEGTVWRRLHLDADACDLSWDPPTAIASRSYSADDGEVRFEFEATRALELTGPMALRLWASSTGTDLDVFVHLHVVTADGRERMGIGPQGGPIALAMGWLRASHRELDVARSLPHRPVHSHTRALPLEPGTPVPLDIEIWPTSIVLAPGERLVMRIRANDDDLGPMAHDDPDDRGELRRHTTTLHTGGEFDAHLLVPEISSAGGPSGSRTRA